MQNKGAIRFFTIVLALVSVYQLLFTVFAQKVEKDARDLAKGDVRIERSYLDSMKGEVIYNVLFKKYTYQECKEREVNLGLDLKGGMNVILEIAVEDIIGLMAATQFLRDPVSPKPWLWHIRRKGTVRAILWICLQKPLKN